MSKRRWRPNPRQEFAKKMAIEYYSSIDLNKNELQNAVVQNAGTAPGSPGDGQIYFDSTAGDKALYYYNGSAWIRVGGQITHHTTDTISSGDFMAFSDESEISSMRLRFDEGIGWGDAKKMLFEKVNDQLTEPRNNFQRLMDDGSYIETILKAGAVKAREESIELIDKVRKAVGIASLD